MFPFIRGQQYSLGELRGFEKAILIKRQADKKFSDELRSNEFDWAKLRNEELVPFELLVNWLKVPDSSKFSISLEGHSGPDIILDSHANSIGIQITVADPDWNGDGGRNRALQNHALGRDGVAWGAGGTQKRGSKGLLTSEPVAVGVQERQDACRAGLSKSLKRKLDKHSTSDCLLIYARDFFKELIDEGFSEFLKPIVLDVLAASMSAKNRHPIFVVDSGSSSETALGVNTETLVASLNPSSQSNIHFPTRSA